MHYIGVKFEVTRSEFNVCLVGGGDSGLGWGWGLVHSAAFVPLVFSRVSSELDMLTA